MKAALRDWLSDLAAVPWALVLFVVGLVKWLAVAALSSSVLLGLFLAFVYAGKAIAALNANQSRYLTVGVIAAVAFRWHAARTVNR